MKIRNTLNENRALLIGIILIFLSKLLLLASTNNIGWEPDEYQHFMQLRTVFADFPNHLDIGLGVWAKPLYAYPFGLILRLLNSTSLVTIQVLNIMIIIGVGLFVFKILKHFKSNFLIAIAGFIIVNYSFLLYRSSLTALTEPLFTLFLISGFYFFLKQKYLISSFLIGISTLGRIEGVFFILIWVILLILQQLKFKDLLKNIVLLFLPLGLWNLAGFISTGNLFYLLNRGYPTTSGVYGYGNLFTYAYGFVVHEPILAILFGLTLLSIFKLYKDRKTKVLSAVIFMTFFIAQTFLYRFGLFGTAGIMRYFISVMPFMIIAILLGFDYFSRKYNIAYNYQKILFFIVLISQVLFSSFLFDRGGYLQSLLLWPSLEPEIVEAGEWVKNNISAKEYVYSVRPEVLYYAERNLTNSANRFETEWANGDTGVYVWAENWGSMYFKPSDFPEENIIYRIDNKIIVLRR